MTSCIFCLIVVPLIELIWHLCCHRMHNAYSVCLLHKCILKYFVNRQISVIFGLSRIYIKSSNRSLSILLFFFEYQIKICNFFFLNIKYRFFGLARIYIKSSNRSLSILLFFFLFEYQIKICNFFFLNIKYRYVMLIRNIYYFFWENAKEKLTYRRHKDPSILLPLGLSGTPPKIC